MPEHIGDYRLHLSDVDPTLLVRGVDTILRVVDRRGNNPRLVAFDEERYARTLDGWKYLVRDRWNFDGVANADVEAEQ